MTQRGLSAAEVSQRIANKQVNHVPRATTRTYRGIVLGNFFNVFNMAVFSTAFILLSLYLMLGDIRTLYDSIAISTVAFLNTIISIIQEIRAKVALDRIFAMSRSTATVLRDGQQIELPTDDIVLDDMIVLRRGDQIPVDGTIVESHHCEVDESLLTGESHYIYKEVNSTVLSGSFCVAGHAVMVTEKVGLDSYIHRLTKEVRSYKRFVSPLQNKIDRIVQFLMVSAAFMALLVIGQALVAHELNGQILNIIDTTRSVASIVTSMIPVGLILLSTVAFALGVFRISQRGALIQKLNAIESFANVDTICMDKTGTLTQNKLSLSRLIPLDNMPESQLSKLVSAFAHHSSEKNATIVAIASASEPCEAKVTDEIPFNSKEKYSAISIELADGQSYRLALGAFERLQPQMTAQQGDDIAQRMDDLRGLRNLILAALPNDDDTLAQAMKTKKSSLTPLGIVCLVDDIRPTIQDVLTHFQQRGISLKILSGDAPETVQAVARSAGWKSDTSRVIIGSEIDQMNEDMLNATIASYSLFARVSPENKKALVRSLQKQGHYVAMVGDGVNDVLALKQAELGIAMGTGNRMSRDVSDIVLLKDDFTVMPEVFSEGETIISNIQSSAKLFITKNTTAVFLILCAGFLGLAFPFVPRHVTIIGFFAISVPALLLAFSHRIQFVPHNFLKDVLGFATISGLFIGLSGLMSFTLSRVVFGQSDEVARTALLTQLVLLSLLNFLIIVGQNHLSKYLRQNWGLVFFALGFASLYFVLLWTTTQIEFLAPIATFLELHTLSIGDMVTAILLTPIAAIGLVFSQKRFLSTLSHPSQK